MCSSCGWHVADRASGELGAAGDYARLRLQIARDLKIPVTEQVLPRELLYLADEASSPAPRGSHAHPLGRQISVGKGVTGPVTRAIRDEFYAIVNGEKADRHNWSLR